MVKIRQHLVPSWNYNNKCPYEMSPRWITVHNTANDAPAYNEVNYMINNTNEVSFHYAVDDKEVVQGIPTNRNTWNAGDGNGDGNMASISVEICYSLSGGDRFIKAEQNASEFIAQLLKERGWGVDRLRTHQSWNGKNCPRRTLAMGWDRFVNMVASHMNDNVNDAELEAKITELYITQLGREPDEQGLNCWKDVIKQEQKSFEEVTKEIIDSTEGRRRFIRELYVFLLGREPDEKGMNDWLRVLTNKQMTREQIFKAFMNSDEYKMKHK